MLICILTKNVITSCSVTMMLFLHLEVKPLMTLTTVLYLSCALISGHLAMMLMELTKRRWASFLVVFNRPINILSRVSLFLSMALCLLLRLFVFRLLRLKSFSTLTLKMLLLIPILLATLLCMATCRRVKFLCRMFVVLVIRLRSLRLLRVSGIVILHCMFLLLIPSFKASHSFRNRLLVICKNACLIAPMILTSLPSRSTGCGGIVRLNLAGPWIGIG